MKTDAYVTLEEAYSILKQVLEAKLGAAVGDIHITSYDKPRCTFHEDGLVIMQELRHRR